MILAKVRPQQPDITWRTVEWGDGILSETQGVQILRVKSSHKTDLSKILATDAILTRLRAKAKAWS